MLEKNTVLLNLTTYDQLKQVEEKYYTLKRELNNCLTKVDKKGNIVKFGYYIENPTKKIKINITKLCEVLEIQDYEIELIELELKEE